MRPIASRRAGLIAGFALAALLGMACASGPVDRAVTPTLAADISTAAVASASPSAPATLEVPVELSQSRHPILGDETYATGFKTKASRLPEAARAALAALGRQALHAERLAFEHPETGEVMEFRSPLPADLAALRKALTEAGP